MFLDFEKSYFDILAKALSCWSALRQQALICSLQVERLYTTAPTAFTDFSDVIVVPSFFFNPMLMISQIRIH